MKKKLCMALLLAICVSGKLKALDKPELFVRIEKVFREQEPRWKVESITVVSETDPYHQTIVVRDGKLQAAIDVSIWKRVKDAQDVFAGESIAFDNIRGGKASKSRIPNLGDENHLWTNRHSTAWPTIKFRKGNINVVVFAPTLATARRFAQRVMAQIDGG